MRVIAVKTLRMYGKTTREAKRSLLAWYAEVCQAVWKNPQELGAQFGNASVITDKRVVFNIHGNKHRLIVDIEYRLQIVFIVWIGSHAAYNLIDSKKITYVKTYQNKEGI